jgi:hypothetical protein
MPPVTSLLPARSATVRAIEQSDRSNRMNTGSAFAHAWRKVAGIQNGFTTLRPQLPWNSAVEKTDRQA